MIRSIDLDNQEEVLTLLSLQMMSYMREAETIGLTEIPPLKDSAQTLQKSGEAFYGFFGEDRQLLGAVSYSRSGETVAICRMIVHPQHLRRGIAKALLDHVQHLEPEAVRFTVLASPANAPAVALYTHNGFLPHTGSEIAEGIFLTEYRKERKTKEPRIR